MRVLINGNELEVEVLGGPPGADVGGKPVMIVHHGAPGLGSRAEPVAGYGAFADRFRVVTFDARGSGESGGAGPFTHAQWVADLDAVRAWAGAERFVLAGGSYGGFIAMEYAIRHPGRVRALVLRDTSPDREHEAAAQANALASPRITVDRALYGRMMGGTVRDDADFRAAWRHILPLYDHALDMARVEERAATTPYHFATHNFAFSQNMPRYDIRAGLGDIRCPTLVTVGRHDWITPVAQSEKIARAIPGAELVVFENSGHSPQVEEAEAWRGTVRAFLGRVLA